MAQISQIENSWLISGDVIIGTAKAILDESVSLTLAQNTAIDFSKVTDIDTTAISLILEWKRRAAKQNASISVINLPENLTSLVKLYGVSELIN
jgi:phospholipid transport system transporter-binding protein